MARGRKPSAPNLKVLAGTGRGDRQQDDPPEFDPVTEFPAAPMHLNPDGAHLWETLGAQLTAAKVLTWADLPHFEQLCFAWQRFRKAAKNDLPFTASEDTALKALFSEFGVTPASRRRIGTPAQAPRGNKFGALPKPGA